MKFCHVTLTVQNLEASLKFYEETVGLSLKRRFQAGPDAEIAFVGGGETEVELICGNAPVRSDEAGGGISIGFLTDSLEKVIAALRENGYETDGKILSPNPTTHFVYAKDPDGYKIQFMLAE